MKIDYDTMKSEVVTTTFNSAMANMNSNIGAYQLSVPQSSVVIPRPFSYEFRVAEWTQGDDVVKVGLQVKVFDHNNSGYPTVRQDWTDVERVRIPLP